MPITYERIASPAGNPVFRTVSSGAVTVQDAEDYIRQVTGPDASGRSLLTVVRKGVEMSPEARKVFSSLRDGTGTGVVAFVVEGAALRITMSFIFRVIGIAPQLFAREEDALAHIDKAVGAAGAPVG